MLEALAEETRSHHTSIPTRVFRSGPESEQEERIVAEAFDQANAEFGNSQAARALESLRSAITQSKQIRESSRLASIRNLRNKQQDITTSGSSLKRPFRSSKPYRAGFEAPAFLLRTLARPIVNTLRRCGQDAHSGLVRPMARGLTVSANWRINGSRPIFVVLGRDRMCDAECGFVPGGAVADPAPAAAFFACAAPTPPVQASSPPLQPGGFFFGFGRLRNLQTLSHRPLVSRCGRRNRPGKSSGPPPFTPSLKVQGDDTHNSSGFR